MWKKDSILRIEQMNSWKIIEIFQMPKCVKYMWKAWGKKRKRRKRTQNTKAENIIKNKIKDLISYLGALFLYVFSSITHIEMSREVFEFYFISQVFFYFLLTFFRLLFYSSALLLFSVSILYHYHYYFIFIIRNEYI